MHICRTRQCPRTVSQLTMKRDPIRSVETHKFLGMMIDNGLYWKAHITELRKNCYKKLNLLRFLSRKSWGADTKILLRLYISLIKPKLDYGCEVYCTAKDYLLNRLKPIQNEAIRIATGAFKSSPIDSLHAITGMTPFDTYINVKIANYSLKILACPGNPLHHRLRNFCTAADEADSPSPRHTSFLTIAKHLLADLTITSNDLELEPIQEYEPWTLPEITYCCSISHLSKKKDHPLKLKQEFLLHSKSHENSLQIYTDGSKSSDGAGSAVVAPDCEIPTNLPKTYSNFSAELNAIYDAVIFACQSESDMVTIFTDSTSTTQLIKKPYNPNITAQKIQKAVRDSNKEFSFCWVPSHVGVEGNERADNLAKRSINESSSTLKTSCSDLKIIAKSRLKHKWREKWRQLSDNKLRRLSNCPGPFQNSFSTNREWERALCRLRIGHTRATHAYLMCRGDPPLCEICGVQLTVEHMVAECPQYEQQRRQHFPRYGRNLQYFLMEADTSTYGPLHKYIASSGILSQI